jgi:hypothetical protein
MRWPPDSEKAGLAPRLDDGLAVKTGTPLDTRFFAGHQGELRSARRVRQAHHLHAAGVRPVFEALLAVAAGQPIDEALAEFCRVPVATYHAVGADEFPPLAVINGGRA